MWSILKLFTRIVQGYFCLLKHATGHRDNYKIVPVLLKYILIVWVYSKWQHPHLVDNTHDDIVKRKHFPRCWPFVRGIHRIPVFRIIQILVYFPITRSDLAAVASCKRHTVCLFVRQLFFTSNKNWYCLFPVLNTLKWQATPSFVRIF